MDQNPFTQFDQGDTVTVIYQSQMSGKPYHRTGTVDDTSDGILNISSEHGPTSVFLASQNVRASDTKYQLGPFLAIFKTPAGENTPEPAYKRLTESEESSDPEPEPEPEAVPVPEPELDLQPQTPYVPEAVADEPQTEPMVIDPLTENTPIRIDTSIGRIVDRDAEAYIVRILLGDMMQHIRITHDYARRNVIDPKLMSRD